MNKKRWIALLSALGVVIAAVLTTAAVTSGGGHKDVDSPLMETTTLAPTTIPSTTTTKKPAPTTTVKLPVPQAAPSDPYAPVPVIQIGTIEIPKIGLVHPVFEGITLTVIDHGPGHWPGSAMPCEIGNSVFPGHRVTHTHPFLNLDQLSPGDKIIVHVPKRDCVYSVTGTVIVKPTDLWVTWPSKTPTLTLIACHPKHSAAERIVVKASLLQDIEKPV